MTKEFRMKSVERQQQILESLQNVGPQPQGMYTNQEMVDLLIELQTALANGVFEKTHAESLHPRDIMTHFDTLAREYGLGTSDTYLRFDRNMSDLGRTIGSLRRGLRGERRASRA